MANDSLPESFPSEPNKKPRPTIRDAINAYEESESRHSEGYSVENEPRVEPVNNFGDPDEDSGPRFVRIDGTDDDFLKDPTDFTDVASRSRRNRILKWVGIIAGSALILSLGIFFGVKVFIDANNTNTETETQQEVPSSNPAATDPEAPNRPILDIYAEAPMPEAGRSSVALEGESSLVNTAGRTLTFAGVTLAATQNECAVILPTDFCLAATSETNDPTVHAYYLKNAAHSRLFEDPVSFRAVEVPGASAAAVLEMSLAAGKMTPVIAVVFEDSSGYMIALPDATSVDEAAALAGTLSVR